MSREIYDEIVSLIEKRGHVPGSSEQEICNYRYLDEGHVDSFNIMSLILEIEDRFGISFSAEDTQSDEFRTIGGIIKLIQRKLKPNP